MFLVLRPQGVWGLQPRCVLLLVQQHTDCHALLLVLSMVTELRSAAGLVLGVSVYCWSMTCGYYAMLLTVWRHRGACSLVEHIVATMGQPLNAYVVNCAAPHHTAHFVAKPPCSSTYLPDDGTRDMYTTWVFGAAAADGIEAGCEARGDGPKKQTQRGLG
jgi:hypothetical protein